MSTSEIKKFELRLKDRIKRCNEIENRFDIQRKIEKIELDIIAENLVESKKRMIENEKSVEDTASLEGGYSSHAPDRSTNKIRKKSLHPIADKRKLFTEFVLRKDKFTTLPTGDHARIVNKINDFWSKSGSIPRN